MARFFVNPDAVSGNTVTVRDKDAFHIARSLRMAVGDDITVCDGLGNEYTARLTLIRDSICEAEISSIKRGETEPPMDITLFMAYPKGDKLETVVQKSVELGASHIVPFESSRCIKRPAAEKLAKIAERLNRIAEEAAKQCGRTKLPTVSLMQRLSDVTEAIPSFDLAVFCYENEKTRSLKSALEDYGKKTGRVAVIIGPEGGFSPEEAERIISAGAACVSLGPRILRCETAPDYCLSSISYFTEL